MYSTCSQRCWQHMNLRQYCPSNMNAAQPVPCVNCDCSRESPLLCQYWPAWESCWHLAFHGDPWDATDHTSSHLRLVVTYQIGNLVASTLAGLATSATSAFRIIHASVVGSTSRPRCLQITHLNCTDEAMSIKAEDEELEDVTQLILRDDTHHSPGYS